MDVRIFGNTQPELSAGYIYAKSQQEKDIHQPESNENKKQNIQLISNLF